MLRILGHIWALPTSLIGLVLAVFGGAMPYRFLPGGLWQWESAFGFWYWLHSRGFAATTFGHISLFGAKYLDNTVMQKHEGEHLEQAMRWGPLFLPAYGIASLWAWAHGGDIYADNAFEKAARAKETS